ncbi:glycosyltransferase [Pseudonocardia sp. GCM10023141]|uniref:glycosyltransferase n=1 Tax=Pseudonocardia sp. GCM10023141 TaxID=3252653 RepID=UPI00360A73A2
MLLPIPGVSVCVPVHNGERFLAEAIRSVLDQTYRDFELVILDNASRDGTSDIVRSFQGDPRMRVEHYAQLLPEMEARNRAVQLSRAPLVKVVLADDMLHPRCLELEAGAMETDPGLALAAGRQHLLDDQTRVVVPRRGLSGLIGVRTGVEVARRIVRHGGNPIESPGGVLFRREDFFNAGGWRSDRGSVADLDLWMRLLQYGEFVGLDETLGGFRLQSGTAATMGRKATAAEQREYVRELTEYSTFAVRGLDTLIGRLGSPVARLRSTLLGFASRRARRRTDSAAA